MRDHLILDEKLRQSRRRPGLGGGMQRAPWGLALHPGGAGEGPQEPRQGVPRGNAEFCNKMTIIGYSLSTKQ